MHISSRFVMVSFMKQWRSLPKFAPPFFLHNQINFSLVNEVKSSVLPKSAITTWPFFHFDDELNVIVCYSFWCKWLIQFERKTKSSDCQLPTSNNYIQWRDHSKCTYQSNNALQKKCNVKIHKWTNFRNSHSNASKPYMYIYIFTCISIFFEA